MTVDLEAIAEIIANIAREEVASRFGALAKSDVMKKSAGDVVTTADLEAERRLSAALADALPGSVIVAEEAAEHNPEHLDRLNGDAPVWIIDPVDGTRNFADGEPVIAVIVALAQGGETVAGWIHDPIKGDTLLGERGGGAWLNGARMKVAGPDGLTTSPEGLARGFFGWRFAKQVSEHFGRKLQHTALNCVGQEYRALCAGDRQFAVYRRLKPWDHAAGVMLHAEAGGYSATRGGAAYRPTVRDESVLLAPDRDSWERLSGVFFNGV